MVLFWKKEPKKTFPWGSASGTAPEGDGKSFTQWPMAILMTANRAMPTATTK